MSRQTVSVYSQDGSKAGSLELPPVFSTPIRAELVHEIFTQISKNAMQPHGNSPTAGIRPSAISWGPGRAKARVPRVNGSGSNRNGQGAYANFCRGGHRFAPPNLMRRWFRAVPVKQRRYAIASAIAASAQPSLVSARGHIIEKIPEIPCVITAEVEKITKTKQAVEVLKNLNLYSDVERVIGGKIHRSSKGKMRRSAYKTRRGPLVIYANDEGITRAFRNIPGVDALNVSRLSLAALAPAGNMGRLCLWTEPAIKALDQIYANKSNFVLPRSILSNTDVDRIAHSDEVLATLRQRLEPVALPTGRCQKRLNPAFNEWQDALKQIETIRSQEEAKKNDPATLARLFKDVVDHQPESPKDLSVNLHEFFSLK